MCRFLQLGGCFGLMVNLAFAQDDVVGKNAPPLRRLRLVGERVTVEALSGLAGRDCKDVTLADAKLGGKIIEALKQAGSIRTLRLFGTDLSGQIPRLERVKGLVGLEISASLAEMDYEALDTEFRVRRVEIIDLAKPK